MQAFDYVATFFLLWAGIMSLLLSRSKRNYTKLVAGNGKEFADRVHKILKIGGCVLIVIAALRALIVYI